MLIDRITKLQIYLMTEKFFTVFEFIKIFLYKAKIYRKNAVILDFVEERQNNGFIR